MFDPIRTTVMKMPQEPAGDSENPSMYWTEMSDDQRRDMASATAERRRKELQRMEGIFASNEATRTCPLCARFQSGERSFILWQFGEGSEPGAFSHLSGAVVHHVCFERMEQLDEFVAHVNATSNNHLIVERDSCGSAWVGFNGRYC